MNAPPPLAIGMPTYNGQAWLERTIESLLTQDFTDFELYISDNGSSDASPQICQEFARRDRRVHFHPNPTNLGAIANFNRAFSFCRSDYFMFAAQDDLREPNFLTECLSALRNNPESVLSFCYFDTIDQDGVQGSSIDDHMETLGFDRRKRLRHTMNNLAWCSAIYGVMRTDSLRWTMPLKNVWGMDAIALMQLSIMGSFVKVPAVLYHRVLVKVKDYTRRKQWEELQPSNKHNRVFLPDVWMLREMLAFVLKIPQPTSVKLGLILDIAYFAGPQKLARSVGRTGRWRQ